MKLIDLAEFRCKWCGKLLARYDIECGYIEIKCRNPECKRNKDGGINTYEFGYKDTEKLK